MKEERIAGQAITANGIWKGLHGKEKSLPIHHLKLGLVNPAIDTFACVTSKDKFGRRNEQLVQSYKRTTLTLSLHRSVEFF